MADRKKIVSRPTASAAVGAPRAKGAIDLAVTRPAFQQAARQRLPSIAER